MSPLESSPSASRATLLMTVKLPPLTWIQVSVFSVISLEAASCIVIAGRSPAAASVPGSCGSSPLPITGASAPTSPFSSGIMGGSGLSFLFSSGIIGGSNPPSSSSPVCPGIPEPGPPNMPPGPPMKPPLPPKPAPPKLSVPPFALRPSSSG